MLHFVVWIVVIIVMRTDQFKSQVLPLRGQLFQYAHRLLNDMEEAEDAIQDVFLKLWYMRESLEQYNNLPAFATEITGSTPEAIRMNLSRAWRKVKEIFLKTD